MQMTVEEIIRNYTEAKDKSKQIGILADLNGCGKEKIRSILRTKGVPLPTKGRPKKETSTRKTSTKTKEPTSTVEKVTWPKEAPKIEDLVQKDEFESPMIPLDTTIESGIVKEITFLNRDTGEKTTQVFDETKPHEEQPIEAKLFIPEVVKGLVIERISQIEFEITKLKLDKEELEDFLEQFTDEYNYHTQGTTI